jgi:hypothetical protein
MYKTFYITRNLFPRLNVTLISTNNKKNSVLSYPISYGKWNLSHSQNKFITILDDSSILKNSTVINKVPLYGFSEAHIRLDDDWNKYNVKLNPMKPYVITKLSDDLDEITFFKIS